MGISYSGFGDGQAKLSGFVASPPAALTAKYNNAPTWITPSGSLGAANGGVAYTFNFQASDLDNDTITYSFVSGTLPSGISLSGNQLVGTPVNDPSTYTFTISISDGNFSVNRTFSLDITNQTPIWNTAAGALGSLDQNTSGTYTLSASDPNGDTITFSVSSGTLPAGMTLSGNVISGTPTTPGTNNFTVTASDGKGGNVDRLFSITVNSVGDAYWDSVSLLMHMDGTNGSTTFTDVKGNTVTSIGTPVVSTSTVKYGTGSVRTGSATGALKVDKADHYNLSGGFTLEAWVNPADLTAKTIAPTILSKWENIAGNFRSWALYLNASNKFIFEVSPDGTGATSVILLTGTSTITTNNWYHVAVSRSGNSWYLFINGVQEATTTNSIIPFSTTQPMTIGKQKVSTSGYGVISSDSFEGYIDDVRITNYARYTSNFTAPTAAFPNSRNENIDPFFSSAVLLAHFDNTLADTTGKNTFVNSGTTFNNTTYKFGGYSLRTGTNAYITYNGSSNFSFTGDFTIECWINSDGTLLTGSTAAGAIIGCWQPLNNYRGFLIHINPSYPTQLNTYIGDGSNVIDISANAATYGANYSGLGGSVAVGSISPNTWYHYALTRSSGILRIFINGVKLYEVSGITQTINSNSTQFSCGSHIAGSGTQQYFSGYIDDVRITKGVARYTSNFAVPTIPFPNS